MNHDNYGNMLLDGFDGDIVVAELNEIREKINFYLRAGEKLLAGPFETLDDARSWASSPDDRANHSKDTYGNDIWCYT